MINFLLIKATQFLSFTSKFLNLGNGSTWPGHLALKANPHIIEDILSASSADIILIIGTNGKTTTSRILTTILKENLPTHHQVVQNTSGANLLNGVASALLLNTNVQGCLTAKYVVFEVDENSLPLVLKHLTPKVIIALNLFRDQLDRYGELDAIAKKWNTSFRQLPFTTTLVLNADDPLIAYLAKEVKAKVEYFGLEEVTTQQKTVEHNADSIYCPQCSTKLVYKKIFYSHLGIWECPNCHVKRPQPQLSQSSYPLPGMYNKYNTLAAVLAAQSLTLSHVTIDAALQKVTPAFGRQETLVVNGKQIQLFLSKNPTSFNESLKTIVELSSWHKRNESKSETNSSYRQEQTIKPPILLVLNDRIPDGRDVSWIWDIGMEEYIDKFQNIIISGDRCFDMGLRVTYENVKYPMSNIQCQIFENLKEAIDTALESIQENETLYILPTYSAMLEVRKILTGRKIL